MSKRLLLLVVWVCFTAHTFAQQVSVSSPQPADNLVNQLFNDACAEVSNISISATQAGGIFNNNGGAFPLANGVVLRTGNAQFTAGPYTDTNLSTQLNTNNDAYLQSLNEATGNGAQIEETTFLEFDFIPLSSNFSFDFIFASNEYGEWQCASQDIVAFVLTDLSTGQSQNLAVTPSGESISVRNIRDNQNNPACSSVNPELFDSYEVSNAQSAINMRGYSEVLNASSTLTPGTSYTIRIVIGDSNDTNFDSAIFLAGGSFNTRVDLGPDLTLCSGDVAVLDTGLDASIYAHRWLRNGTIIPGQTGNSITVNQSGTYTVRVTNKGCVITDEVIVSELSVTEPSDIEACANGGQPSAFDLRVNDTEALGLNADQFDVVYYASLADLNADQPIAENETTAYPSTGSQTIYLRLRNTNTGSFCDATYDFELDVLPEIAVSEPNPLRVCTPEGNDVSVDLTPINNRILGSQNPALFQITYYASEADANSETDPVESPYLVSGGTATTTLWARVSYVDQDTCYEAVAFDIMINDLPPVDQLGNVITCNAYELEALTNGDYYSGSNGSGIQYNAGDIITEDTVLFIYNGPDANGCSSQSSFSITFVSEYDLGEVEACGAFVIPPTPAGAFYTESGGPDGTGVRLNTGDELTSSQTIYFYFRENGSVCRDEAFNIIVYPLPPVDMPSDVVACNSFMLPALTEGAYFTEPDGGGLSLNEGDEITTTQSVYIYNYDSTTQCSNTYEWRIFIVPEFSDLQVCGSYTIPAVEEGAFYTAAMGGGSSIPEGTQITSSQRIYYYVNTTAGSNCTDNSFFELDVIAIPEVDTLSDQLLCEGETYTLPALTDGEYFEESARGGTQYVPGDVIDATQTIYINNEVSICQSETQFTVEIRPLLPVDNLTFVYSCEAYVLPELNDGRYFTEPQGQGMELASGTEITQTQTIYVYNAYEDFPSCYSENTFTINILGVEVEEFEDVASCDSYTLPALIEGDYFTESGGQGTRLAPGDVLTSTQEVFIYARNGTRFFCEAESSFTVTISETPVLVPEPDVEQCGRYTLPTLPQDVFTQGYYLGPDKQAPIDPAEYELVPGTYTIYKYAEAADNPDCFAEDVFEVIVYPLLDFTVEGGTVCRNAETGAVESPVVLDSGLNPSEFLVSWFLNEQLVGQGQTFTAEEAGIYTVSTEKIIPEVGAACNYNPTTVEVFESAEPIFEAEVTQPFAEVSAIEITVVSGFGEYEYRLDDQSFQNTPEFINVAPGVHTVTVRGVKGTCGEAVLEVQVINYPKYFTPNNDGYHDTWNITSLEDHPEAQIFIFDRFGKLIKNIAPTGPGWDGTYRGRNMPSDDYWFRVAYTFEDEPAEFKAHFTLKR
ncbi:gliding motility-associated-like protein [Leeuwenhoekiella aestuarii]|uniref:T9SS type B sorting domain-containing protein n=1 Tax=Leeuwenhoekiella aestuarii TaxID=2249426 RepID=UPI000FFE9963|nr:T9SS type B sorting domain-containing protein [Leeuwenhoekiella aestuarii]RXG19144.1 gliding motility-associated-like protein [Leeuwenhoekiella aestuarii]